MLACLTQHTEAVSLFIRDWEIAVGEYACDLECSGLLEGVKKQAEPKLHNFAFIDINSDESYVFNGSDKAGIQDFLNSGHKLYIHNVDMKICTAISAWFGFDITKSTIVDTLPISWYLYPDRQEHGLGSYGVEFGVPQPVIEDWSTQTQADYDHRVVEDCRIQKRLWLKQKEKLSRLYEGVEPGGLPKYQRLINYLMWKVEQLKHQAANKVLLDISAADALQVELEAVREAKVSQLFLAMPKVPVKAKRTRPAKPFLKNGELSATGLKWDQLTKERGVSFDYSGILELVIGYDDPNPASPSQIKDWLYSLGWAPTEFKFDRQDNGDIRKIPQVNMKGGLIAPCVEELVEVCPDIEHLTGLGVINHRLSVVKGFLRDAIDSELSAGASGFTNTLRLKHREVVNLPSSRVAYGKALRGLLIAREGMVFLGSDLSSLENRLLHHYQWRIDRAYVETQLADDYDPHLALGVMAGLLTQEESDWYKIAKKRDDLSSDERTKYERLDKARAISKNGNYACQYGSGVDTLSRTAKISKKVAKQVHTGYNDLNWSVKKLAGMTTVKKIGSESWQFNPISKLWYSLRSDKDRVSTLIQGSGSYVFDIWVYHCFKLADKAGLDFKLSMTFHDEQVVEIQQGFEDVYQVVVMQAIGKVNQSLKLNRDLDCDVQFGSNYSGIH